MLKKQDTIKKVGKKVGKKAFVNKKPLDNQRIKKGLCTRGGT